MAIIGDERCLEETIGNDGRQSPAALEIQRGVIRLLAAHGISAITELGLPNGLRADAVGLSSEGDIWIVEIKSCLADYRADTKWPGYREFCDELFLAVAPAFPVDILSGDAGLILADRYGGEIVRRAPVLKVAPARRKAMTLRFARIAASRLHFGRDPEFAAYPVG